MAQVHTVANDPQTITSEVQSHSIEGERTLTIGIIRALDIIRVKKLISNAVP